MLEEGSLDFFPVAGFPFLLGVFLPGIGEAGAAGRQSKQCVVWRRMRGTRLVVSVGTGSATRAEKRR